MTCATYALAVDRQILLLRGVNLGPRNRIAMPALRDVLTRAGFEVAASSAEGG